MNNKLSPILFFWLFAVFGYNSFLYLIYKKPQQTQQSSIAQSSAPMPSFDAHMHLRYGGTVEENAAQLNRYLDETGLEGMFVLSESYHGEAPTHDPAGYIGSHSPTTRQPKNAFTGQVLNLVRGQSVGLCGYSPIWPDGVEIIADCLRYEKMQGLKLRSSRGNFSLQDPIIKERFRQVLQAHSTKIRYVLAHMADGYSLLPIGSTQAEVESAFVNDQLEVETVIQLAAEFPQVQFIFGHSLYSDELVQHAARYRNELRSEQTPLNNLWIETSTALSSSLALNSDWRSNLTTETTYDADFQRRLVSSWREFGIERVLFGSDILLGGDSGKIELQTFDEIIRERDMLHGLIGPAPNLSEQEFEQITRANWRALFD